MSGIAAEAGGLSRNRSNHPRNRCMDGAMQALLKKLITPEQLIKSAFFLEENEARKQGVELKSLQNHENR